ncbi:hypothetical protein EB796_001340 [Bugula neritina]|uniref:Uncharacterized protein n=1 Tax=Bugula neritina TaxID=10212 RepID=A0A7J7KQA7_BUGNE|nr:hypothetical protein EB796_001340 [Bugula neritina]
MSVRRSGRIYEILTCLVGEPITANSLVELLPLKLQRGNGGSILIGTGMPINHSTPLATWITYQLTAQAPASPALTEELETSETVNMDITDVPPPELCSSLLESERPLSETRRPLPKVDAQLSSCSNNDEAHHYGMAVAAKLRRLQPYQMAVARRDIELALFNAEYNIQNGSADEQV